MNQSGGFFISTPGKMTQTSVGTISPRWEMEIPLAGVSLTKAESIFHVTESTYCTANSYSRSAEPCFCYPEQLFNDYMFDIFPIPSIGDMY